MWKSGTFDFEDINEKLIEDIVFFKLDYPRWGVPTPGYVMFMTHSGDEYVISQSATDWDLEDIVKLFPGIYEVLFPDVSEIWRRLHRLQNQETDMRDEYRFEAIGNWKIIHTIWGPSLVRMDYFEKFYSIYQMESEDIKEFPEFAARLLFGKKRHESKEFMEYRKNKNNGTCIGRK